MKQSKIEDYILRYAKESKHKGALMLSGDWGCGKTYYVKNILRKHLDTALSTKKTKHTFVADSNCVYISLYGLKNISEVSKAIYIELRTIKLEKKSEQKGNNEAKQNRLIFGKAILNGILGLANIDINIDENDLNKVYESIDLSNKLIIFDDLERSTIPILDFLGYLNSFVENDGIKVLIVANENELIKYSDGEKIISIKQYNEYAKMNALRENLNPEKKSNLNNYKLTHESIAYLKSKEKTIYDTIEFEADIGEIIKDIIISNGYDDKKSLSLNENTIESYSKEFIQIMNETNCNNLRYVSYACQKTIDFINDYQGFEGYRELILFGTFAYVCRKDNNNSIEWDTYDMISSELGTIKYPLFRQVYNYILHQTVDPLSFNETLNQYNHYNEIHAKTNFYNEHIEILKNFYIYSENELNDALEKVEKQLKDNTEIIPLDYYDKLLLTLIRIELATDIPCKNILDIMRKNLSKRWYGIQAENFFGPHPTFHNDEEAKRFRVEIRTFINEINKANALLLNSYGSLVTIREINEIFKNKKYDKLVCSNLLFVQNPLNILEQLVATSNKDIVTFRGCLMKVFDSGNYEKEGEEFLKNLDYELEKFNIDNVSDKVKKYQINLLKEYIHGKRNEIQSS